MPIIARRFGAKKSGAWRLKTTGRLTPSPTVGAEKEIGECKKGLFEYRLEKTNLLDLGVVTAISNCKALSIRNRPNPADLPGDTGVFDILYMLVFIVFHIQASTVSE
jgi:hypothetical protein